MIIDEADPRLELWNDPENEDNYEDCDPVESNLPHVRCEMIRMIEEMLRTSDRDDVRAALDRLVEKL
jgi:hypothetical protein